MTGYGPTVLVYAIGLGSIALYGAYLWLQLRVHRRPRRPRNLQ